METAIKNRNESFFSQVENFGLRQRAIYRLFITYVLMSDDDISKLMRLPINSITGRRRELVQMFFVKAVGTEKNAHTKKSNTVWDLTSLRERDTLVCNEVERLRAERFTRFKDLEIFGVSDLTKKDILNKVNKISELINKLEA